MAWALAGGLERARRRDGDIGNLDGHDKPASTGIAPERPPGRGRPSGPSKLGTGFDRIDLRPTARRIGGPSRAGNPTSLSTITSNCRLLVLGLASLGVTAEADMITVCEEGCDFVSINAAIATASDGDVLVLSPETYREGEPIDPAGRRITLRGVPDQDGDGDPETILDGALGHPVLRCLSGETRETVFENLVIRNGSSSSGGGMLAVSCEATFLDCVFVGNRATDFGGAVLNYFGALHLERCEFRRNYAGAEGGAMVDDRSASRLLDCTFLDNETLGQGGGLACMTGALTSVTDGTFRENRAAFGGAIFSYQSSPMIVDSTFVSNVAGESGASLHNLDSSPTLQGCVFEDCCSIAPPRSIVDAGGNDLAAWCRDCRADLDCSGDVGAADLARILVAWGTSDLAADLDGDGLVRGLDLGILFVAWGGCD